MQKQQQEEASSLSSTVSFCPSFNSYASVKLVNIAARVSQEFRDEESKSKVLFEEEIEDDDDNDEEEGEFEFVSTIADLDSSSRLFLDGEIRQIFPVFNRNLLLNDIDNYDRDNEGGHVAAALKNLFIDDDDDDDLGRQATAAAASSSDEDDESEGRRDPNMNVSFCIWRPKRNNPIKSPSSSPLPSPLQSPSRCKKSNSTGSSSSTPPSSSKKWFKLRDLLKRSNSDGKDSFVFLHKPKNNSSNVDSNEKKVNKTVKKGKAKASAGVVSAHEAFYVKNRAIKEGDRKKSYLPYRQDLFGVFATYNGLGKILPPSF